MSLRTIDSGYLGAPEYAATYLLRDGQRALFVETNTQAAVPQMLQTLRAEGMAPEQVEYIIITHVHLDHAGGASALMAACPNAVLLAHPRAARHVIDPSKLVASATQVYGAERFRQLYGVIEPIPENRVKILEDGAQVSFGQRTLTFLHTRGHANHHFVIHDSGNNGVFTGDAFGIAYPALQKNGPYIFPSTSPTDFDPTLAQESVDKIVATGAQWVYLTHYGVYGQVASLATQLKAELAQYAALLAEAIQSPHRGPALVQFCTERVRGFFERGLDQRGLNAQEAWDLVALDVDLNGQGVAYTAEKARKG